jgi:hypothetical protein
LNYPVVAAALYGSFHFLQRFSSFWKSKRRISHKRVIPLTITTLYNPHHLGFALHPIPLKRIGAAMNALSEQIDHFKAIAAKILKERKGLLAVIAVLVFFQLYYVRELLAAELLFGIGFAFLFVLGLIFYGVGAMGVRAFDGLEVGVRVAGQSARRGYSKIEDFSKRPFRHPRSESAQ